MSAWTKIKLENRVFLKTLSLLSVEELQGLKERKRKSDAAELDAPVLDMLDRLIAARRITEDLKEAK
jgi:hypothetical protein